MEGFLVCGDLGPCIYGVGAEVRYYLWDGLGEFVVCGGEVEF